MTQVEFPRSQRVLIVASGTGGHLMPAKACAEYFLQHQMPLALVCSQRPLDQKIWGDFAKKVPILQVSMRVPKKNIFVLGIVFFQVIAVCWKTYFWAKKHKITLFIGFGGYLTLPCGLAAKLLGIPLLIHEQNAIKGKTNTWLQRLGAHIVYGLPLSASEGLSHPSVIGNPIRPNILQTPEQLIHTEKVLHVLILGGSQGAEKLNTLIFDWYSSLQNKPELRVQVGQNNQIKWQEKYKEHKKVEVFGFVEEIGSLYNWADVVVCRAGAMTVCELAALAKTAIFVPYPFAAQNHQFANAQLYCRTGGGWVIAESEFGKNFPLLWQEVSALPLEELRGKGQSAKGLYNPNTLHDLYTRSLSLLTSC